MPARTPPSPRMSLLLCPMLVLPLLAACASTGAELGAGTVDSMEAVGTAIRGADAQVAATIVALNELSTGGDMAPKYERFQAALSKLESEAARVTKRSDRLQKQGALYFRRWEEELDAITSDVVRKLSDDRRRTARERFERVQSNVLAVKEALDVLLIQLGDIRAYLDFNLNASGMASIVGLVQGANEDAAIVRGLATQVEEQLAQAAAAMSARTTPPG